MLLPKIYPITDVNAAGISHAEQVKKLISGGAEFIQLREKEASSDVFFKSAEEAVGIARANSKRLIINDRVDIAAYVKADGVHLGQHDLPPSEARKILGKDAIIGFSTHSKEQALKAIKLPVDYIAIGPVFETKTKSDTEKAVGLEGIAKVRNAVGDFPLVAIGGITFDNFREVLRAGTDSVALISGLLSPPDSIEKNFRKMRQS
ncbi:MAG: thiamine phosphate synthase [Pyrinomonadaceae bacterium]|nr:thiamine phosphate synthase [Pyrinomonadaceae bacterium]